MTSVSDLAVIIATHQRDGPRRALAGLDEQTVQGFETIVAFGGRSDLPQSWSGSARAHTLAMAEPHPALGMARNRCVEQTDRPLLLLLADDVRPAPDLVRRHLERHAENPEVEVVVQGRVEPSRGDQIRPLRRAQLQATGPDRGSGSPGSLAFDRFDAANASVKRALFERAGGYEDDLILHHEDLDLAWRLDRLGMRLLGEPGAVANHGPGSDAASLERLLAGMALSERVMAAKHDWFRPAMLERVRDAMRRRPVAGAWAAWLAGRVPPGAVSDWLQQQADARVLRKVGHAFLAQWERAVDVIELREYLGEDFQPALLIQHDKAVADEILEADDEESFYRTSQTYLYDLTVFGMSGTKDPYLHELRSRVPGGARLLDYGCGIGADGLRLLEDGYDVHFADYDNPSTDYLRWRLARRGRSAPVHDIESDEIPAGFDAAYAFDVIEHVADPLGFLRRMEQVARLVVVNLLEEDEHDEAHEHLHHDLPIEQITAHAESRGLVSHTVHHGRSHLLVYEGQPAAGAR